MTVASSNLSADHRRLLGLLYDTLRRERDWPTYAYLNAAAFQELGLDLDSTYGLLPPGLLQPPPEASRGYAPLPEVKVALTLEGLEECEGTERDITFFLAALRFIGRRAASFRPPMSGAGELTIGSTEIAHELAVGEDDPSLFVTFELLRTSVSDLWSSLRHPDEGGRWSITLRPERARRYRDVQTAHDVRELRPANEIAAPQMRHLAKRPPRYTLFGRIRGFPRVLAVAADAVTVAGAAGAVVTKAVGLW